MEHEGKVCCACNTYKQLDEFQRQKRGKFGRRRLCTPCHNLARKEYRKLPHVKEAEKKARKRRVMTPEQRAAISDYRKSPERMEKSREAKKTPEAMQKRREYLARPEVRERVLALRNARYAAKEKTLAFKFDSRLRILIRRSSSTGKNNRSWRDLVDFSIEQFQAHFEKQFTKGMNWDEFKAGNIHIDHIVAITDFNITSVDCPEFKACWALGNLRPMWSEANNKKRAQRLFLL